MLDLQTEEVVISNFILTMLTLYCLIYRLDGRIRLIHKNNPRQTNQFFGIEKLLDLGRDVGECFFAVRFNPWCRYDQVPLVRSIFSEKESEQRELTSLLRKPSF